MDDFFTCIECDLDIIILDDDAVVLAVDGGYVCEHCAAEELGESIEDLRSMYGFRP